MKTCSAGSGPRTWMLACGLVVLSGAAVAACGGGGGNKATTTTSTTTAATGTGGGSSGGGGGGTSSGPSIVSFGVPSKVTCTTATTIKVSWSTTKATEVVLSIDGPGPYKTYPGPSGSDSVPFACDGHPHTYMITAKGPAGQVTRTVTVTQAGSTATTKSTSTTKGTSVTT